MSSLAMMPDPPASIRLLLAARGAAEALLSDAVVQVATRVASNGQTDPRLMQREQRATHGLAWFATYAHALGALANYAERMERTGRFGEIEQLLARIGAGELLSQMAGGIAMSQGEVARPTDLGLDAAAVAHRLSAAEELIATGNMAANRARLVELISHGSGEMAGDCGLDEMFDRMRTEMRRFVDSEVRPYAPQWHRQNSYIPLPVIARLAALGVFGLTIPEEFGGLGLGKEAMCVVSEELARGYLAVGSISTRTEIAAELDSRSRQRNAKTQMAAEARVRRGARDGRLHRAGHRVRSCEAVYARRARRRGLSNLRQ